MNFSFVLPSRGNWDDLKKMFDSFERTTKYKHDIEFLVAINENKEELQKKIKRERYSFPIRLYVRPHTKDFTNDYYNWLANRSSGKNIIAFNDDAWIRTVHWDKKILNELNNWHSDIHLIEIPDSTNPSHKYGFKFPCFPCISRRAFATLGFVLCKDVKMFPADFITYKIYAEANCVIRINNVLIEHEHIEDYNGSKKHMNEIFQDQRKNNREIELGLYIHKITQARGSCLLKKKNKLKRIINILKER